MNAMQQAHEEKKTDQYYETYRKFWQDNLENTTELLLSMEKALNRLEVQYSDFDRIFNAITGRIDMLSSIYSSYNSIQGREYLLKLRSMMNEYRKRYTAEGVNFNILYFLYNRIRELQEKSYEEYPRMKHRPLPPIEGGDDMQKEAEVTHDDVPYKWITFERNDSWFIIPYDCATVIPMKDADIVEGRHPNLFSIKTVWGEIPVTDLLSFRVDRKEPPGTRYLLIDYRNKYLCLSATRIGKRIMSRRNIFDGKLKTIMRVPFVSGRLRLFGKNHLYINHAGLAHRAVSKAGR